MEEKRMRTTRRETTRQQPLPNGTAVAVDIAQGQARCRGRIVEADCDGGWLYRIEVATGDACDEHRNEKGDLWVCDFEVRKLSRKEAGTMKRRKPKTAEADTLALAQAIHDHLSPEGVAAVAAHLQALHPSKKKSADRQVVWFHDFLVGLLGDDEYARLSVELGF